MTNFAVASAIKGLDHIFEYVLDTFGVNLSNSIRDTVIRPMQ
jgi:hypothetical protein